jgi:hypothetical protein
MKSKDYFQKLKEQGKINKEDYDKFLETVPEFEIPDPVFQILDSSFLTIERAISHKDVNTKLRRDLLDPVDLNIKSALKHLPAEDVLAIEREESTYQKMLLLNEAIPKAIQKASKAPNDEEAKKKLQESQTVIQELTAKFNKLNEDTVTREKALQKDYDGKIKGYRLNAELEKLANSYTFADVHKDSRPYITKAKLDEIRTAYNLDLVDTDGNPTIQIKDEHGAPLFENGGNTPVAIQSLLDGKFKPFLKVSNADEGKEQQQTQQHQATKSFTVNNGQQTPRRGADVSVTI